MDCEGRHVGGEEGESFSCHFSCASKAIGMRNQVDLLVLCDDFGRRSKAGFL